MTTATPNYNTITIKDGHVVEDSKRQDKKEATTSTFLQSMFRNKLLVTVIGVVCGSVVFMTYSATNQVATITTTTTSLLRVNGQVGGITGSSSGNDGMSRRRKPIKGTKGTCTNFAEDPPSSSSLTVMTFNTFLIYCLPVGMMACEEYEKRGERIPKIADWFHSREEDVIVMQEIWSYHDEVVSAMTEQAGYCHYTIGGGTTWDGSGLAIFSKYEILEHDFIGFGIGSWTGWGLGTIFDAVAFGKGVLYAKIRKGDQIRHIFNTQTLSDQKITGGDQHYARVLQYKVMDDFIRSKAIPKEELVIIGGDMNEDKYCQEHDVPYQAPVHVCEDMEYYQTMLKKLSVALPPLQGDLKYTYTSDNTLVDPSDDRHYNQLLDYVVYRNDYLLPNQDSTTCTIMHARDPAGNDLSDHEAMTCEFQLA